MDFPKAYSSQLMVVAVSVGAAAGFWMTPSGAEGDAEGESSAAEVAAENVAIGEPAKVPVRAPSAPIEHEWSAQGCTAAGCHGGIEPIREPASKMFRDIVERGARAGDPDGCTVCHGGTVGATTADEAHSGTAEMFLSADAKSHGPTNFYADPASPWVNEHSCGPCHEKYVMAQWSNLMMSEAGKIQGAAWGFGAMEGYEHKWANYDYQNPEDRHARLGSDAYRLYMEEKTKAHPNVFVDKHEQVPAAPSIENLDDLAENPERAGLTYLRAECQRCHLGVKGRSRRGDFRGMGCGACHMPYGNEGLYEGSDATIAKGEVGHALVHSMQGSRRAKVRVHGEEYSGIPVETCSTCHNRGKRIGVSYQGLMESAYGSPYTEGGGGQPGLHSKHYLSLSKDVHYQKGMLCQDCHSTGDVHGDGFIAAANLAAVEIECSDCHGTPTAYPWELPLGYGDENGPGQQKGDPRGTGTQLPKFLAKSIPAKKGAQYILSARGNPLPDAERVGERVIVHLASGKDLELEPLKTKLLEDTLSPEAKTAMVNIPGHMQTMECYTCHSSWAPQCYGCHIEVDYSEKKVSLDWVAAGNRHATDEHRTVKGEPKTDDVMIPGHVQETRSYLRWENPALGVNGEGRVTPIIPGCQTSATIIDKDGKNITLNKVFRSKPGTEGAKEGQLGSDMSPVHPHTVGKSRSCESCHVSQKALGYGIGGEGLIPPWDEDKIVDLTTADGRVLPKSAKVQIGKVEGLKRDWSAVVTPDGKQLQTVGHHFKGSGPLSQEQREKMDRRGTCVGCHQEIPDGDFAMDALHHVGVLTDQVPHSREEHQGLVRKIVRLGAWSQIIGAGLAGMAIALLGVWAAMSRGRGRRDKK